MTEGRCLNCRWWRPNTQWPGLPRRQCMQMHTTVTPNVYLRVAAYPESKAIAKAGPLESACVWTAPDFGCVQWEARDD